MTPQHTLLLFISLAACAGGDSGEIDPDPVGPDVGSPNAADAAQPADAMPWADAQPVGTVCSTKEAPVQLGYTCVMEWSVCSDQTLYGVDCRIQNLAGNIFSLCDCSQNGTKGEEFISSTLCSSTNWEEAQAIVNENCGWDLR